MPTINLGRIKPVWRGYWSAGTAYVKDDMVRFDVDSYICTSAHTSGSSFSTGSGWELMMEGSTIPSQTGNSGKALVTDGNNLSWGTAGGVVAVRAAHYTTQFSSSANTFVSLNCAVTMPPAKSANSRYYIMAYSHADDESSSASGIGLGIYHSTNTGSALYASQGTHHNYNSVSADKYFHANLQEIDGGEVHAIQAGEQRTYTLYGMSHNTSVRWNPTNVGGSGDAFSKSPWSSNVYGTRLIVMEIDGGVL